MNPSPQKKLRGDALDVCVDVAMSVFVLIGRRVPGGGGRALLGRPGGAACGRWRVGIRV